MKIDLHCHTHFSDGTQSPEWVVAKAIANGVTHLAITDHDHLTSVEGLAESAELNLISGVELSCNWSNIEVHVVGLFTDHSAEELNALVESQQASRLQRVTEMAEKLSKLGTTGLLEYLQSLPARAYTRSHVLTYLVANELGKNRQKCFKQYLSKGGKIYVPAKWCELHQAIATIHSSGGIAVLAHPGRYPLNRRKLKELVNDFSAAKGDGLEVRYPNIDPQMAKALEDLGIEHELHFSGGSDFHDPNAHWTDVGKFPAIRGEAETRSVQHHERWRISP